MAISWFECKALDWITIAEGVESIVTSVALVAGGLWAFHHYFYGRTYKPRLSLNVEGELVRHHQSNLLTVNVLLRNRGLSRVKLLGRGTALRVLIYRKMPSHGKELEPEHFKTSAIFESHAWIEPGEVVGDTQLFSMPEQDLMAVRLEARVIAKRMLAENVEWETSAIVHLEHES